MESDSWVRNKQTIDVSFFEINKRNMSEMQVAELYYRNWNRIRKLPSFTVKPFSYLLLCFCRRFMAPFAHVNVCVHDMVFERCSSYSEWRPQERCGIKRFRKVVTLRFDINNHPSYDELMKITSRLEPLKNNARIVAYMVVLLFLPLKLLGYDKPGEDCITSTEDILSLFGIEIKQGSFAPVDLFKELTEEHKCQIIWTSSKNLS